MTDTPVFAQTPFLWCAIVTAATTSRQSPGANVVQLGQAGANGALIPSIWAIPRGDGGDSFAATECQLYLSTDAGSTKNFLQSTLAAGHSIANNTGVPATSFTRWTEDKPLYLPANAILYAGIGVAWADGIAFWANGANN